jgi:hypothetical protein
MDHHHHDSTTPAMATMPSTMPMTFFTSTTTPLYTTAWKPTTPSHYALTCLFLVLLCIVFRALLAARCNLQVFLQVLDRVGRKKAAERGPSCCAEGEVDEEGDDDDGDLRDEKNRFRDRSDRASSRKRATCGGGRGLEIFLRALLDTSLAVVSYLL